VFGGSLLVGQAGQSVDTVASTDSLPNAPGLGSDGDKAGQGQTGQSREKGTCIVSGTVLDTNGDVVEDAHVALTSRSGAGQEIQSGLNGEFAFSALPPGAYRITITGKGMGTWVSPWFAMQAGENRIISQIVLPVASAASSVTVFGDKEELAEEQVHIAVEQRVLGIFPNFYSSYDWTAPPMGTKQKFKLAFR
jgi:hypothetical protein